MTSSDDRGERSEPPRSRVIVHLTASPFLGGPERQMIGLATVLPSPYRTAFLGFPEGGCARPFLEEVRRLGFETIELRENAPHYRAAIREVAEHLRELEADVLCCHGYKPDILGLPAARRAGLPVVAVSRGWTGATWKVRLNEALDRAALRRMDRVVCVSEGQAIKVRRAGVLTDRVVVIRNAIRAERYNHPDPAARSELLGMFPSPPSHIVGAAGRLSPEKGFAVLVAAARLTDPSTGFIVFGDGPLGGELRRQITAAGLGDRFLLGGFRDDLDRFIPHFDVLALPSYTEGLPNVALEASAAGTPIAATAVGGTPEVVEDGFTGFLVPPGDAVALGTRIGELLATEPLRREMGRRGRERVRTHFTFEAQALAYQTLFEELRAGWQTRRTKT